MAELIDETVWAREPRVAMIREIRRLMVEVERLEGEVRRLSSGGATLDGLLWCPRCHRVAPGAGWSEAVVGTPDPGPRCPTCWEEGEAVVPAPIGEAATT